MVEEELLRKVMGPSFVRIFDTNVLRTMVDRDVIYRIMSPWNITTNYLIGFRSTRVCFPVKVITLYPYRTFTVFLGSRGLFAKIGRNGIDLLTPFSVSR